MRVLALSSNYEPLGTIPWEKAINLIFTNKVLTVGEYEQEIRSPTLSMKLPSVIVYKSAKWRKLNSIRFSRRNVWLRDEGRCQYCSRRVSSSTFTLDHVFPKCKGGKTSWENVVACCYECNQKKGNKALKESGMKLSRPAIKPSALPYVHEADLDFSENNIHPTWKFWLNK
jgi:5-methylcytosine-specific restriction endonuclease McrA